MKTLIKRLLPKSLFLFYRNKFSKYRNKNTEEVFTEIFNSNQWSSSESISGVGSEIEQTKALIPALNNFLSDFRITSVLDIPCGDFNWMKKVDLSNITYTGADIVEDLIENNKKQYGGRDDIEFLVINLITDSLPKCDLIIVRDCFVHLSYNDISTAIKNIKSSGCKYLLTTTFLNRSENRDIVTGNWRPLNLQIKPFNFPKPILVINENCTEGNGDYKDKSMALWEIFSI